MYSPTAGAYQEPNDSTLLAGFAVVDPPRASGENPYAKSHPNGRSWLITALPRIILLCPVGVYPSLTPYKRRLQAGHADGWGLGGPHTEDVDQIPQIPNSGSNPLEETLKGPGSNLAGGATRGGRS